MDEFASEPFRRVLKPSDFEEVPGNGPTDFELLITSLGCDLRLTNMGMERALKEIKTSLITRGRPNAETLSYSGTLAELWNYHISHDGQNPLLVTRESMAAAGLPMVGEAHVRKRRPDLRFVANVANRSQWSSAYNQQASFKEAWEILNSADDRPELLRGDMAAEPDSGDSASLPSAGSDISDGELNKRGCTSFWTGDKTWPVSARLLREYVGKASGFASHGAKSRCQLRATMMYGASTRIPDDKVMRLRRAWRDTRL